MNRILTYSAALLLTGASLALADIPSLINYQGRLTTEAGAPVTGSKNFALSIYDAATGGNLLYSETVGAVTLDANGVYSFQFGSAGTSNTRVTETIATTDGTATTFQKVLSNSPVVAGSVSVGDGTFTWSQIAGSSNEDEFGVAYSTSLRRVTATYYNGAPAAGRAITATYSYGTSGITGALSSGAEHWMVISVDGTAQATRQRVVTVPFAMTAARSEIAQNLEPKAKKWRPSALTTNSSTSRIFPLLRSGYSHNSAQIPITFQKITNVYFDFEITGIANVSIWIERRNGNTVEQLFYYKLPANEQYARRSQFSFPINITLDPQWIYRVSAFNDSDTANAIIYDIVLDLIE